MSRSVFYLLGRDIAYLNAQLDRATGRWTWRRLAAGLGDAVRRARCAVFGHRPTINRWDGPDGPVEWHHGCARCPIFWAEPVKVRRFTLWLDAEATPFPQCR